jgi:hypothetical protein
MALKRRSEPSSRGPLAKRIVAQRATGSVEASLERLEADFADASRYDIVASLKELEKAGVGQFVVGRKGQRSRFVWNDAKASDAPRAAKKAGATRVTAPSAPAAADAAPALSSEPSPKGSFRKALVPISRRLERQQLSSRDAGAAPPAPRSARLERAAPASSRPLQHAFHLRPGLLVKIELPEDVTPTEVERFCTFLKAIPFAAGTSG